MQDFATADLIDIAPETPSCEVQFNNYGLRKKFSGKIRTIRCFRDNGLVKKTLNSPSTGEVLVVDGGGSLASALIGDQIAEAGRKNGWAGAVVFGVIRDSSTINTMDFGIKALGTNPKKSAKDGQGQTGIPLSFGNIEFKEGDFIYCDEDGILVSPTEIKS
ncbi:MAG: ribonuclease E activity regulator RraA [Cardiobacteriaceae bacterium]|nr:ribonuclease E activity regulator RraA [Cardiobacteriaceae bacterium]